MSGAIEWDAESGNGQSVNGLVGGFAEYMICVDMKRGDTPFYARHKLDRVTNYYATVEETKGACQEWHDEQTRPIPW